MPNRPVRCRAFAIAAVIAAVLLVALVTLVLAVPAFAQRAGFGAAVAPCTASGPWPWGPI